MPDGKPPNEFAFDAKPKNKEFAIDIIKTLNVSIWKKAANTKFHIKVFVI